MLLLIVTQCIQYRLLDSLVVECWLQVREVPGLIPVRDPKDVIKWYKFFPCLALNIKTWNTDSFSRIKIEQQA